MDYNKLIKHSNEFLQKHGFKKYTFSQFSQENERYERKTKLFKLIKYAQHRGVWREYLSDEQKKQAMQQEFNSSFLRLGRDSFFNKLRDKYANITRVESFEFLRKQEIYQMHLQQPRERVVKPNIEKKINSRFQMDHVDLKKYEEDNDGYKFLFVVVDVFSRYAWVKATYGKGSKEVVDCLREILDDNEKLTGEYPSVIQSDNAQEFHAVDLAGFLKRRDIKQIWSPSYLPQMQAIVERLNRTIKGAIFTNFTKQENEEFIDIIDKIVYEYNHTVHSSIKDKPANIHKYGRKNIKQLNLVNKRQQDWAGTGRTYPKLRIGSKVRLHILTKKQNRMKEKYAKKYLPQWSEKVYKVEYIMNEGSDKLRPKYVIKGEEYFRHDLQKV
jgi:transposase InsO family protein